ncbi:serine/threonine protein kinase [Aestuariibacter salexigens]|uniref:serine/threonine protein kinase n=1 Tax=Aestuariibacter salexigens TaxID=226010 RepID=UPI000400DCB4|nr:serine/threonine protein kinase [Aestuariibacter salexigens]
MTDFTFSGLSPDLILDAIESLDVRVNSGLLALNSYENRVYQFIAEDNKRYVVKFYRPQRWSDEQIAEEHDFALELASHEIPIVAPLALHGRTLHHAEGYRFVLYPSVGGRQFEVDNLDQLEWMGRYVGRMHKVAQRQSFQYRPAIDIHAYIDEPLLVLRHNDLIPTSLQQAFFAIAEPLCNAVREQYQTANTQRLHGDCHPGNILWHDGPQFVDLDDSRSGPAVQDLWMMLSGDRQQQQLQFDTLIEAYEEFSDFDTAEVRLIEPLRAMRMIHYMAWLTNRWQDPAFPRAFPWFADDKYWEQQILALKEQLAALQEPPLRCGQII